MDNLASVGSGPTNGFGFQRLEAPGWEDFVLRPRLRLAVDRSGAERKIAHGLNDLFRSESSATSTVLGCWLRRAISLSSRYEVLGADDVVFRGREFNRQAGACCALAVETTTQIRARVKPEKKCKTMVRTRGGAIRRRLSSQFRRILKSRLLSPLILSGEVEHNFVRSRGRSCRRLGPK